MDIQLWWITFLLPLVGCANLQYVRHKRVIYRQVCFDKIGCFNNSEPFDNAEGILPDSPDVVNVKFLLLTRENEVPDLLDYSNRSLKLSHFKATRPVAFLVHGFAQSAAADWVKLMGDALLLKEDCNVVVVDWGPGAKFPHYLKATANTRLVGRLIHMLIERMTELGAKPRDMHLIGHSLGAHIAGYAGQDLQEKLGQITGLDPADPLFEGGGPEVRLDRSDAVFVGVVHTNGAPVYLIGSVGMYDQVGHADFYVNGGEFQPGCKLHADSVISDIFNGIFSDVLQLATCSHSRSHDIYLESIRSADCIFTAYPCENTDKFNAGRCLSCNDQSCARMGYHVNTTHARGKYFMKTRGRKPFCGLQYGVTFDTAAGGQTKGQIILTFIGVDGNVSDPIQLFHREDVTLHPGRPHEYVVVVSHGVVDIAAIEITYKKHTSWIVWTNGIDHWLPQYIRITPGGKLHRETKWFCLEGMSIRDGIPTRVKPTKGPC